MGKTKWISVKKRRPKVQRGSHYAGVAGPISRSDWGRFPFIPLLFAVGEEVCAGRFFGRKRGYWSLQGVHYPTNRVTHWQPMPAPPEANHAE